MRIEKDQLIAGVLAKDVRRVMRRVEGCLIRPSTVASILGLSKSRPRRILNGLEQEGLVAAKDDFWEITAKGRSLTMATAATPLRRATAESLITKLIERAKMINDSNHLAYRVQRLVVFGSVARGAERPNDVDVACSLVPRFQGDRQRVVEEARRGEKRSFANSSEWAGWPKLEVLKILKSRSRGLSIQEVGGLLLDTMEHRIVFSDEKRRWREASGRMPASSTGYTEFLWLNPSFHHDQLPKIPACNGSALRPVSSLGRGAAAASCQPFRFQQRSEPLHSCELMSSSWARHGFFDSSIGQEPHHGNKYVTAVGCFRPDEGDGNRDYIDTTLARPLRSFPIETASCEDDS